MRLFSFLAAAQHACISRSSITSEKLPAKSIKRYQEFLLKNINQQASSFNSKQPLSTQQEELPSLPSTDKMSL
jgi:hypothetical protein